MNKELEKLTTQLKNFRRGGRLDAFVSRNADGVTIIKRGETDDTKKEK